MELHSWTICCLTGQIPTTLLPKRHNSERCRSAGTGPKSILTIIYIMIKLPFTYRTNCWNNTVDFILLRMWAYQLVCTLYIAHWASTTHTSASQSHSFKREVNSIPIFWYTKPCELIRWHAPGMIQLKSPFSTFCIWKIKTQKQL